MKSAVNNGLSIACQGQYGDDFVAQVQRILHTALVTKQATAEQVAALFSIHPRTLNRRLKASGTNFQKLADQSRYEIAQQWLELSSMELSQIAAALGYAEASAFTRAFRRWSGKTPSLWRKRCQQTDSEQKRAATASDLS